MNLGNYSGIVVSISGGKDSQTILGVMARLVKEQNYAGKMVAVHADTGAEWPQSLPHCKLLCDHYQIPRQEEQVLGRSMLWQELFRRLDKLEKGENR